MRTVETIEFLVVWRQLIFLFDFRNTDVLVSPSLVNDVIEYFEEKKMDYTVMIPDLQVYKHQTSLFRLISFDEKIIETM